MVIILEGIDRVGKTTLAAKIAEEINGKIFKAERVEGMLCTVNENNAISYGYCMGQVQLFNNTYATSCSKHIIIDRFHWTEYVYTKLQRDKDLDEYYLNSIEKEMLKCKDGYIIIQMMPIDINVCSRMHGSDLSNHQKLFNWVFDNSKLNKYRCTYMSTDLVLDMINQTIKDNKKISDANIAVKAADNLNMVYEMRRYTKDKKGELTDIVNNAANRIEDLTALMFRLSEVKDERK